MEGKNKDDAVMEIEDSLSRGMFAQERQEDFVALIIAFIVIVIALLS